MRPSPSVVKRWFDGVLVPEDMLAYYISILLKDPNWGLVDTDGGSVRRLRLLYYPDGEPFDVVLDRTATGWLPRVSKPLPALTWGPHPLY